MIPLHTLHTREVHSGGGGGRSGGVANLSRADVATPERSLSEINPGIKQNCIFIVKEMFSSRHVLDIPLRSITMIGK